ncbi:hypothetical protein NA57DRAFT_52217 [Rhizodiscina lignyota]|uniref:Uncharacterized protein n=1 Tax=Rhizodiscina lignyota TaxID=1504668 RepID=A0A9P4M9C9_9PEZI|nr:hypothetical protein NA57DRAFT_52217 [Rhizodiscina lignyota]
MQVDVTYQLEPEQGIRNWHRYEFDPGVHSEPVAGPKFDVELTSGSESDKRDSVVRRMMFANPAPMDTHVDFDRPPSPREKSFGDPLASEKVCDAIAGGEKKLQHAESNVTRNTTTRTRDDNIRGEDCSDTEQCRDSVWKQVERHGTVYLDPSAHGNGPVQVSVPGFAEETDYRIMDTAKTIGGAWKFTEDLNAGDSAGVGHCSSSHCNIGPV